MVAGSITFDGQQILATFLNDDVQPEVSSAVLAFDFVALVFQKLDDLLLERGVAVNHVRDAVVLALKPPAADPKRTRLLRVHQIQQQRFQTLESLALSAASLQVGSL